MKFKTNPLQSGHRPLHEVIFGQTSQQPSVSAHAADQVLRVAGQHKIGLLDVERRIDRKTTQDEASMRMEIVPKD